MTSNQIAYWSYKEGQRHNLETEAFNMRNLDETRRHNLAYETETRRHNVATEAVARMNLEETGRHNLAMEAHNASILSETVRSNVAREDETQRSNVARETENTRSNQATEAETKRSNLIREEQQATQLKINWVNAIANGVDTLFDAFNQTRRTTSQIRTDKSTRSRNYSQQQANDLKTIKDIISIGTAVAAGVG